ncbi:aldo/keto reductase [Pararhizobium mangrovi]|uniref:Aldo/keto reductase n=1 Tax=Pararhizobium mangrovi TaxID=2590452 RepID=A0A506U4K3_9HYPH|nr:aldo/keto reductase [Pararhizobium mangrovi]TPW29303.1 aldo/keto reductase [Pararhizobium mangrovi]
MEYRPLGRSGLMVSRLVLGTLTFGGKAGFEKLGNTGPDEARRMIDTAREAGVNMIDTADLYSMGGAEEVVGEALSSARGGWPEDMLIASKARFPMGDGPNAGGASRYHLLREVERSLKRLGRDHIDLYYMHQWDGVTPIEETMAAIDTMIEHGKIRYAGLSNYNGWQTMKALSAAERTRHRPVAQQVYYTPEAREAEYELLPVGLDQGLGTMIWSPLGEGLLSGTLRRGQKLEGEHRQNNGWPEPWVRDRERLYDIIDCLVEVGEAHGVSAARVCLAWLLTRPGVTGLVIGARNEEHLTDNLAAVDLTLSEEEIARIEKLGRPMPIYPYWHRAMNGTDRPEPADEAFMQGHRETMGL